MRIRSRSQRTSTSISKIVWKTALRLQELGCKVARRRSTVSGTVLTTQKLTTQKQQLQRRPYPHGRVTAVELYVGQEKRLVVS